MKIDAYLDRIGYRGPTATTRETLREIHVRHPQSIPFENLDSFGGVTAKLDIDSLEQKLVQSTTLLQQRGSREPGSIPVTGHRGRFGAK